MRDLKKGAVEMWFPSVYPEFIVVYPTSAIKKLLRPEIFVRNKNLWSLAKATKRNVVGGTRYIYIYIAPKNLK